MISLLVQHYSYMSTVYTLDFVQFEWQSGMFHCMDVLFLSGQMNVNIYIWTFSEVSMITKYIFQKNKIYTCAKEIT